MGKIDITDRSFFSNHERFAELINVNLYHGENILLPEKLITLSRSYPSMSSSSGSKNRDILMKDIRQNICYGMEIETESDYSMPERVMTYDVCEYEQQIKEIHHGHTDRRDYQNYREKKSRMKKSDFLLPTITVVLFLGEGHWAGRRTLSQLFCIPPRTRNLLGSMLHDYDFPLIEADFTNSENYRTDLKEFFQAMQCRKDRKKLKTLLHAKNFQHLKAETEQAIAIHLHIQRLTAKMEKEDIPMCKAFDDLMKEQERNGKREGRKEGKREGRKEEKIIIIRRMLKAGLDESIISRTTKCTRKELAMAAGK